VTLQEAIRLLQQPPADTPLARIEEALEIALQEREAHISRDAEDGHWVDLPRATQATGPFPTELAAKYHALLFILREAL